MARDPNISFIPKKSFAQDEARKRPISLFLVTSVIVFVITLAAYGGLWYYNGTIKSDIDGLEVKLQKAAEEVNEQVLEEGEVLESRISRAQEVLDNHIQLTPFFDYLERNTLEVVYFDTFEYDNESHSVQLKGKAPGFSSTINQRDVFRSGEDSFFTTFSVDQFSLAGDGSIEFTFAGELDVNQLRYMMYAMNNQSSESSMEEETENSVGTTTEVVEQDNELPEEGNTDPN